jgi:hypothetical protein
MSCSKAISAISFAEIIHGRDASVRVTHDGFIYAVDLVMVVTTLERDQAGLALRRVLSKNLLSINLIERNTGGKGNARTQLINLKDALQLIMVLPGEMAKTVRAQIGDIMTKFFAGDESLVDQIQANASSTSPIAQMARQSLGMSPEQDPVAVGFKRKREELELLMQEEEVLAKRVNRLQQEEEIKKSVQARIMDERTQNQQLAITACAEIERMRDPSKPTNLDERTRLLMQDFLQNSILNSMQVVQFTGGQAATKEEVSQNKPISISSVAKELGYKASTNDSKRIGSDLSKRYFKLHGKPPSKHDQLIDGRVTSVNSYTEQDRPLVEQALHAYFKPSESDGEASE